MQPFYFVLGLLVVCVLTLGVLILFPSLPDPTCASLLARSQKEVPIALPSNCARIANVGSDNIVNYLDNERNTYGLIPKEWVTCAEVPAGAFAFMNDPHWLPSYVPGRYQFRRTVIIVPYAQPVPQGSPVVAEISVVPWGKYIRQIAGKCDGKFAVWK
jgi:hypothetical protein